MRSCRGGQTIADAAGPARLFADDARPGWVRIVDCRDLMAPWGTVRVTAALRSLRPDERIQVLTVDPTDIGDLRAWCERTGGRVVSVHSIHGTYVISVDHPEPVRAPRR